MKKKKLLSLLLAASMTLSLAACGGSSDKEEASGNDTVVEEGGGTITLGMIGPLTGSLAVYGTHIEKGVKLAIEEINAAGGDRKSVV